MTMYLGESEGGRILSVGGGVITQVGDAYQVTLEGWPITPAGPHGDVLYRLVSVVLECVGGYDLTITPIVDGVEQTAQTFNGSDTGRVICQAHLAVRGTAGSWRVETNSRPGTLTIHDVTMSYVVLRETP